jgi:signal peptidase I
MNHKPRKWWIAGLLSLVEPGLGQVYNGQARKGLLILTLPLLIIPGMILCLNAESIVPFLCAFLLLVLGYYIVVVSDAILTARKLGDEYQLKQYNKTVVYVGIILLVFVASTALSALVKNNYIKAYKIPASSMAPTLFIGDHILVDRRSAARIPNHGDLVIFEYPVDPEKDFIKRVVAVGGDTLEIRNKELWVNNKPVNEAYVIHKDSKVLPASMAKRDNYGPVTVPPDSYFVMGDNRDESYDSRFWGFVEKAKIKGTVRSIYWSWDHENSVVRWSRIGTRVL